MFKKYWTIIKTEFQRQFTYRSDIASFMPGNFLELFGSIIVWTIIFKTSDMVAGYTYIEMMSYVVIGWVFMYLTSNYNFEEKISDDIHYGRLTNFLIRPMSYLKYTTTVAMGRVIVAFLFVIFQSVLYILFFKSNLLLSITFTQILILSCMLILAFFIKIFFSILIGMVSFWTMEIVGLQAFLNVFIKFFAGSFFPLALLPAVFVKISLVLPFAYTFFIPTQYYIGKITEFEALRGLGIQFIWLIILYIIIKIIWRFGLKKYESFGI